MESNKYLLPAACVCGGAVLGAALWRAFAPPSAIVKCSEDLAEEGPLLPSAEATLALIKSRRSFFPEKFVAGEDVPKAVINNILEAANWAPTHGNTEPWRFVVRRREEGRERGVPSSTPVCAVCCVLSVVCCVARRAVERRREGRKREVPTLCVLCGVCGLRCAVCELCAVVRCALWAVGCALCAVGCVRCAV